LYFFWGWLEEFLWGISHQEGLVESSGEGSEQEAIGRGKGLEVCTK